MKIKSSVFVKSSAKLDQCPTGNLPEFAFIGRSNVGKSSLINMLMGQKGLAKTSSTPGKTQTINHFIINDEWYIVDLPGYGYAKTSKSLRGVWTKETENYIIKRENLCCLFILLDSRINPQKSDLDFMEMAGINMVPFVRVFTKSDKVTARDLNLTIRKHNDAMKEKWENLPPFFVISSTKKTGREELLDFIEQTINNYKNGV